MKPYLSLGKAVASIWTDTRNTMGQLIVALYIAKEYLTKFKSLVSSTLFGGEKLKLLRLHLIPSAFLSSTQDLISSNQDSVILLMLGA